MTKQIKAEMMPRMDEVEVLFPHEEEEDLTAADKAANSVVEELSSNAEKGKIINIYKQTGTGQESMAFVMSHPADKYSIPEIINQLKQEYGGGDYRFMIRNEKGKIIANKLICIARKLDIKSGNNQDGVYGVLERMMDKQDEFMRRMMDGNKSGNSRMEFMQELVIMKDLFSSGEKSNPMGQMKEMFEMIAMVKEQANPKEEDEGGGFTKMITEAMPLLNTMAQAATKQPLQQNYQPNPQRRQRKPQSEQEPQNMQKTAINQLLAMSNEPAADVAEKLSMQIPEAFIPQIELLILGDDAFDKIKAINPLVEDKKEWFLDVIEWLKGFLGHPSKYGSEFDPIDTNSQKDDNMANSTKTVVNSAQDNQPNDGNTEWSSGDESNT